MTGGPSWCAAASLVAPCPVALATALLARCFYSSLQRSNTCAIACCETPQIGFFFSCNYSICFFVKLERLALRQTDFFLYVLIGVCIIFLKTWQTRGRGEGMFQRLLQTRETLKEDVPTIPIDIWAWFTTLKGSSSWVYRPPLPPTQKN